MENLDWNIGRLYLIHKGTIKICRPYIMDMRTVEKISDFLEREKTVSIILASIKKRRRRNERIDEDDFVKFVTMLSGALRRANRWVVIDKGRFEAG